MQLINHSSDFASTPFAPLDPQDYESCKQAYDDYMVHVMGLLAAGGATGMSDVRDMVTSDGKKVLEYIVDAVAYSDLAIGLLYTGDNEHTIDHLLNDGWDTCDVNGYTGEDVTRTLAENEVEVRLSE